MLMLSLPLGSGNLSGMIFVRGEVKTASMIGSSAPSGAAGVRPAMEEDDRVTELSLRKPLTNFYPPSLCKRQGSEVTSFDM